MRADPSFQAALIENTDILWTHVDFTYGFLDEAMETMRAAIETELNMPPGGAAPEPAP